MCRRPAFVNRFLLVRYNFAMSLPLLEEVARVEELLQVRIGCSDTAILLSHQLEQWLAETSADVSALK